MNITDNKKGCFLFESSHIHNLIFIKLLCDNASHLKHLV